jgi:hypothetical protein
MIDRHFVITTRLRRPAVEADARSRRFIARLYRGIAGYGLAADEGRLRANRATVYGELSAGGLRKLLRYLQLSGRDVFYDLGCGVGKLVAQVAAETPARKCVGIEIARSRWLHARFVADRLGGQGLIRARHFELRNENFLDSDLADATVLYTCSTCFSARLMNRLARKIVTLNRRLTLVTFKQIPRRRRFELAGTLDLQTSWRTRCTAYVYRVLNKPDAAG